jgi:solute carrier family 25 carnitine/acylcarnitine transporter 20/29
LGHSLTPTPFHHPRPLSSSSAFLAATTLTGVAELALYCPAEVIKTQLQVGRHPTVATAATSLWKAGGMRAMYMGGLPMLMRNVVGNATFFCSYASIQSMFGIDRSNGKQPSTTSTMASGATAGALYYFVGHPFDTVQAVMKAQSAPKETFSGMMDAVR